MGCKTDFLCESIRILEESVLACLKIPVGRLSETLNTPKKTRPDQTSLIVCNSDNRFKCLLSVAYFTATGSPTFKSVIRVAVRLVRSRLLRFVSIIKSQDSCKAG